MLSFFNGSNKIVVQMLATLKYSFDPLRYSLFTTFNNSNKNCIHVYHYPCDVSLSLSFILSFKVTKLGSGNIL